MITVELLKTVLNDIEEALGYLTKAGERLDKAVFELEKHDEEKSSLGETLSWTLADVRRIIMILYAFSDTWRAIIHEYER